MQYDFKKIETEMLEFWKKNKIYESLVSKNKGKKKFYFLDGPPYTSGTVHIGTAWNKSMKDMILRYKRMTGFDAWDRAGYDMHGLPTESKIRKKHNLLQSKDIEQFGVEKFNKECEKFAVEMMEHMNLTFKRLGIWMDFDNSYKPITQEFIEGEWWLVKRAHEQGRLYPGLRTMPWCAFCQTNLAKHELEYNTIQDPAIFVKFQVKGKQNEYFIIWTTTPWTIPLNLAIMANPDSEYVSVQAGNEIWILAKELAKPVLQKAGISDLKISDTFTGKQLAGKEYIHPFSDEIHEYKKLKETSPNVHTIVLSSEYVDLTSGSGLVHCAPGCGPEDYEVGHRNKIPPWNIVNEQGVFPESMGEFKGLIAKKDDKKFVEALKKRNAIALHQTLSHEYGHCQRCHNPIIFRTTKQWFFKVEDLKPKMIDINNKTTWVPISGYNAFDSWLKNLRDNSITKQNFWGTPVPIWECSSCGKFEVISTVKELEEKSKKKITNLHKPWIDEHEIPCECGKIKRRVPDVLDVWVDAGTASWNCLDYPNRKDLFEKYFPADFILEGKDQIRGWFNLLMVAGIIALDKQSFKSVYMHGYIQDSSGRKMSKSLGNYIEPKEVVDVYGADTFRYYAIGGANPGFDFNYNHDDAKTKHRNLIVLWNIHNFVLDLAKELKFDSKELDVLKKPFGIEEQFILSKLQTTILKTTELFESYKLNEIPLAVEDFFLSLSRTYIQMVRDKASVGAEDERKAVLHTLSYCLTETLKLFAPIAPFITDEIWKNMRKEFLLSEESVHACKWPAYKKEDHNPELEESINAAGDVLQAILNSREKAKISLRWPVKTVHVVSHNQKIIDSINLRLDILKSQANCKEITAAIEHPLIKQTIVPNMGNIGKSFGKEAPKIAEAIRKQNASEFLSLISEKGKFEIIVEGKSVLLTAEHITIERSSPKTLIESEFKNGFVYLDVIRTPELDGEGHAREIMRRVQQLRKDSGLAKGDVIELCVQTNVKLSELILPWISLISEKCGAVKCELVTKKPAREYSFTAEETVKEQTFNVYFDLVKK